MTEEALKKLKSKLPRNHAAQLSEKLGYSRVYITYVLSGKRRSDKIINAAIDLAEAEEKKRQKLIERINAL